MLSDKDNLIYSEFITENTYVINKYTNKKHTFSNIDNSTNQTLYLDDSISIVLNKINMYLCNDYNTTSDYLFVWYELDENIVPLNFIYENNTTFINPLDIKNKIDNDFIDKNENVKLQPIIYLQDLLLKSIKENLNIKTIPELYYIHLYDFLKIYSINQNIKYNKTNWPKNIPNINLFYNGILNKYWPKIEYKILTNHKTLKDKLNIKNIINNSVLLQNNINKSYINDEKVDCLKNNINILKIHTKIDNENILVNLIRMFSDIILTEDIPFVKLILDDYIDSYYKVEKSSIYKNKIKKHLLKHWIQDFKTENDMGYNTYINYSNVIIYKLFISDYHCSIIIHKNGLIEVIIDRIKLKNKENEFFEWTNPEINVTIITQLIEQCNIFLKKQLSYFIGLDEPIKLTMDFLNDNTSSTKVDLINCELYFDKINWNNNYINNLFDNLYTYTRRIHEKYYYKLKNEDSVYLRYKRVNNYNNEDTIDSILSTLSNPRLNLSKSDIIDNIQKNFDLSYEDSEEKYNDWWDRAQNKISNNKKYYQIFSNSEPGVEINIIQRVGSNYTVVELNDIHDFSELNDILIFLKTTLFIYKDYIENKTNWYDMRLFNKNNKNKNLENKIYENKQKIDDINDLLNDTSENYINPIIVDTSIDVIQEQGLQITDNENVDEEWVDPFLDDDMIDIMEGGGNIDITRYNMRRLTNEQYDPNLFRFVALQNGPIGTPLTYSRICGAAPRRQPIVVTNEELDIIDINDNKMKSKSYFKPPGTNSLKFGSTKEKKNQLNYICPKYWDIDNNISLPPDKKFDPFSEYLDKSDDVLIDLLIKNKSIDTTSYLEYLDKSDDVLIDLLIKNKSIDTNDKKKMIDNYNTNYISKNIKQEIIKLIKDNTDIEISDKKYLDKSDDVLIDLLIKNKSIGTNDKNKYIDNYNKKKISNNIKQELVKLFLDNTDIKIPDGYWDARNIIPANVNKGKVEQTIYDRGVGQYWRNSDPTKVDEYQVKSLGQGYRKEKDIEMPCCFTKPSLIKKENTEKKDFIFGYQIPSNNNLVGKLNDNFNNLINQDTNIYCQEEIIINNIRQIKDLIKKINSTNRVKTTKIIQNYIESDYYEKINISEKKQIGLKNIKLYGFLKIGIGKQTKESLLYTYSKIFDFKGNINEFKNFLINKINIKLFQSTDIFNLFKVINKGKEHIKAFKSIEAQNQLKLLNINLTNLYIDIKKIQDIEEIYDYFKLNENGKIYSYIFELYLSFNNFKNYILSVDYKHHDYFNMIIENIFKCNIILFEDIHNTIKIINSNENSSDYIKYIFIIKKGIYYEPILFKMELYNKNNNSLYDNIDITPDQKKILNRYDDIKIKNLYIFNYDKNKTFNIESNNLLQSIFQEKKTNINEYISIYSVIKSYYKGFKYILNLFEKYSIIINKCYIDSFNNITHLITTDNYIIPIKPIIYQYPENIEKIYDLYNITQYKTIDNYNKFFKKISKIIPFTKIDDIVVDNKNMIVNIIINNNYIPIKPEKYDSTKNNYNIISTIDLRKLDKEIQIGYMHSNKYEIFNESYTYDKNIENLFKEYLSSFIMKNKQIIYNINVEDDSIYKQYINKLITLKINKNSKNVEICDSIKDINVIGKLLEIKENQNIYSLIIILEPQYIINKIINDNLRIKEDKRILLFIIISCITQDIIINKDINKRYKIEYVNCFNNKKCEYPCLDENKICKLLINNISYNGKNLMNKLMWIFVDLLLIKNGNLNKISYYNLDVNSFINTVKNNEYYFTYKQYIDNILEEIYISISKYINII